MKPVILLVLLGVPLSLLWWAQRQRRALPSELGRYYRLQPVARMRDSGRPDHHNI